MIRVILAEDQSMVRGALAALLNLEDDIEVIGEASNGIEAWELIQKERPDLCILDIEMPEMSGLDVAEKVKEHGLSCKVMILTTFARPGYLQRAMKSGAKGYLLKDSPVEELAKAIRQVHKGAKVISPELVVQAFDDENPLTDREQEVLKHALTGIPTAEIAKRMFLSEGTVRNYLSEIMQKVGAKNRMEAVRIVQEKGWI
jgi:two-component system, NarL family, response regulator DesR